MSLEDLNLKINVGLLNAESALSTLGQIDTQIGKASTSAIKAATSFRTLATTGIKTAATEMDHLAHSAGVAASSINSVGSTLILLGGAAGAVGGWFQQLSGSVLHFVHSIHAAQIAADLLSTAFAMLMVPLKMIGSAAVMVFNVMRVALSTVLLPVRILWSGLAMVAKVVWGIVGPITSLAASVFKVWFVFKGWIGALKTLFGWLNMLPPKVRLLVGGLLALGLTGKVGAFALRAVAGAARIATNAFQLLSIPVLLVINPMRALTIAMNMLGRAIMSTGNMALRAASGLYAMGASVGSAVGSVVSSIAGKLVSAAKAGITTFLALGAAASAWGIKMAVKAETATVVFGTMLKDMKAGKALMNELEGWSGAPLFDPEAIQLSGTLLFKAGIAAKDITGKLDQLGNIAAATKTPIEDLARVYQQGMNQGAFGQDKINQLSDRGIAIYEGLAHATGKSGAALKEMISDGKIGPAEMNAALEHLTTGTGLYAGAMVNLGQTTGGMWSGLMNKAGLAARELGINLLGAFDAKGIMAQATSIFSNLRSQIANAMPAFMAVATVVKAAFSAVWEVVTVVFSSITGAMGVTSGNFMQTFLEWAAIATWAFKNWPDIAMLAFTNVGLALVRFGADFAHLFTGVMPALFSWFGDNWSQLFMTAASFIGSVFTNIGKNIMAVMTAVWDFIASGGTKSFSVAWTPLLDGFKNTVKELPNIPPRAIGQLESQLASDSERLAESLSGSLADEIATNMKMLEDFNKEKANAVAPTLDGAHGPGETPSDSDPAGGKGKSRTSFAVDSLDRGSEAALKAVFANQKEDKTGKQQLGELKKIAKAVAKDDGHAVTVQGAV